MASDVEFSSGVLDTTRNKKQKQILLGDRPLEQEGREKIVPPSVVLDTT